MRDFQVIALSFQLKPRQYKPTTCAILGIGSDHFIALAKSSRDR